MICALDFSNAQCVSSGCVVISDLLLFPAPPKAWVLQPEPRSLKFGVKGRFSGPRWGCKDADLRKKNLWQQSQLQSWNAKA